MAYRIEGLNPEPFWALARLTDEALEAEGARRVVATARPGFPCRVTLEDAEPGERLILVNHVSHDVATPFRASHAIYVREGGRERAVYRDALPPVFAGRTLSLRGFDADGFLRQALLATPEEADAKICAMVADPGLEAIHAHYAAPGCFAAKIVRD